MKEEIIYLLKCAGYILNVYSGEQSEKRMILELLN